MGVVGEELRDDDADVGCVWVSIVVVCACESIFRFPYMYVDRIVLLAVAGSRG
jgi:hypothetical protein